jgi:DNA polymerase-3 subunit gamma/tau
MRTCLSCRARLREFRATPERVAALVPPAALVASDGSGPLRGLVESLVGASERFHAAAELATGQKIAAVAASAAALAGGGTAIDEFANHQGPPTPQPVQQVEAAPVKEEVAVEPAPVPPAETPPADVVPEPPSAPAPPPAAEPASPPPDPAAEFAPGGPAPEPATAPPPDQAGSFAPSAAGPAGGSTGGTGEFAP